MLNFKDKPEKLGAFLGAIAVVAMIGSYLLSRHLSVNRTEASAISRCLEGEVRRMDLPRGMTVQQFNSDPRVRQARNYCVRMVKKFSR